jgi:hypothetical protein
MKTFKPIKYEFPFIIKENRIIFNSRYYYVYSYYIKNSEIYEWSPLDYAIRQRVHPYNIVGLARTLEDVEDIIYKDFKTLNINNENI